MQRGEWVLLDEMNLASQSVLEGLNACLDHRGEAYIPELDKSFKRHPKFTVFAAQNPQYQGGGRKGLPKSFVNRFTVVYVDTLKAEDLNMISRHLFPSVNENDCSKLIEFMSLGRTSCYFTFMETAFRCISNNIPLILTGPTNSGKTDC